MLKIVKYDFKALFRSLMPLYLAVVVMSLTLSVTIRMEIGSDTVYGVMAFVFGTLILISFVLTVSLVVRRYRSSVMEDEAYLTFSLPVSTSEIVGGKLVSNVVWVLINYVSLALAGVVIMIVLGGVQSIEYLVDLMRENGLEVFRVVQVGTLSLLYCIALISLLSLSFQIGHLFKSHQILFSVAAFILLITVENYISEILFDNFENGLVNIMILFQLIWIILCTLGQWFILDKHLNLN